ncbi:MAG: M20 family metallopeptidase [Anaerolineae bacterium]
MSKLLAIAESLSAQVTNFARRLVQTPSLPGQEREIAALVEAEMKVIGYDEIWRDAAGNVIGRLHGCGDGHSVMLNGHMDHVDPGPLDAWQYPPYAGTIADDRLHGRGAADMKGALAAELYAVAVLKENGLLPVGDVLVAAVVQEETGGLGTQCLLEAGLRSDRAIVGEATNLQLTRGHRGRLEILATVEGRSVHASVPERGANPHYTVARFLERLREMPLPSDPDFRSASVAPTIIAGDQASSNVTPGRLVLHLDYRNLPEEGADDITQRLRRLLAECLLDGCTGNVEIERSRMATYTGYERVVPNAFPPFQLPADHPILTLARHALAELTGTKPNVGVWRFSTDGGHLMEAGIPTIGYGPGEEHLVHTTHESIAVADLTQAAAGYAALCLALSQPDTGS